MDGSSPGLVRMSKRVDLGSLIAATLHERKVVPFRQEGTGRRSTKPVPGSSEVIDLPTPVPQTLAQARAQAAAVRRAAAASPDRKPLLASLIAGRAPRNRGGRPPKALPAGVEPQAAFQEVLASLLRESPPPAPYQRAGLGGRWHRVRLGPDAAQALGLVMRDLGGVEIHAGISAHRVPGSEAYDTWIRGDVLSPLYTGIQRLFGARRRGLGALSDEQVLALVRAIGPQGLLDVQAPRGSKSRRTRRS